MLVYQRVPVDLPSKLTVRPCQKTGLEDEFPPVKIKVIFRVELFIYQRVPSGQHTKNGWEHHHFEWVNPP